MLRNALHIAIGELAVGYQRLPLPLFICQRA